MLTVVTGWSPKGWIQYGKRFLETFNKYWPAEVRLVVYVEEMQQHPRAEFRLIWDIPGCRDFIERYRGDPSANGRAVKENWKPAAKQSGYNWRFDAWKFCRQAFIPLDAATEESLASDGSGLLCWLDGDVATHAKVPAGFIEKLLPVDKDVAYLGRHPKHSEIGFQLYRLPASIPALQTFRDIYASGAVFNLKEWHSAFVFDAAIRESGVRAHNLTPGGQGHVWFQSPLGQFTDHLKGKRKVLARSPERQ